MSDTSSIDEDRSSRGWRAVASRLRRPRVAALAAVLVIGLVAGIVVASTIAVGRHEASVDAFDQRWGWGDTIVSLITSGEAVGTPDLLVADVAVESSASSAATATDQVGRRQRAMIDALLGAGVARTDVAAAAVDVRAGGPPFTAVGSAKVTVRRLVDAPRLLDLIVAAGADPAASTRIDSVQYGIGDTSALLKQAQDRANDSARTQAQQYADTVGMRLGELKTWAPLDPVDDDLAPVTEPAAPAPSAVPTSTADTDPPKRSPRTTPQVIRATLQTVWQLTAR